MNPDFEARTRHMRQEEAQAQKAAQGPGGKMRRFILGALAGLVALPVLLTQRDVISAAWNSLVERLAGPLQLVPEQYQTFAAIGFAVLVVLILVLLTKGIIRGMLTVTFILGLIIGVAVWFPFGRQAYHMVPPLAQTFPDLDVAIEGLAGDNQQINQIMALGESVLPVPQTEQAEELSLPQVTNGGQ